LSFRLSSLKRKKFSVGLTAVLGLLWVAAVGARAAAGETLAFTGARILPVAGAAIERGVLVIEDGRIAAIGAEGEVAIPAGAPSGTSPARW
jgi:hypothetical protein